MGACASSPSGDPAAEARSREIDKALREDEKKQAKTVKLLLLGAGASGKSTVLKQMRLLHDRPFSGDEIEDYRKISFSNLITGLRAIIDQLDELGIAISPGNRKYISLVDNEVPINTGEAFPARYCEAVKALWADPAIVEVYKRAHEFALQENLPYFFEKIDQMFQPGWTPTNEDILRVRAKTTGISETRFELKGDMTIRLFDVGGQRSERRKWISAFEAVTSVLFLASLADYNASLIEDADSNGMMESLILFESIVNSQWFTKSSIILFLNKADVLASKIRDPDQQVKTNFPDFNGKPGSFNDAVQYFQDRFKSLNRNPAKEIYIHVTTATSTENIQVVMAAVLDTIVRNQLRDMAII